jgi:hypothetical protein
VRRYWKLAVIATVIAAAFLFSAVALLQRTSQVDRLIYDQCVANETQDAVIVAQLRAAKRRAKSSLPVGSAELLFQLQVLDDGIAALEPPEEPDCPQPEGTSP